MVDLGDMNFVEPPGETPDRKRILLVEDNEDYTMLITDALKACGQGYEVTAVNAPEKALDLLDRENFDLVLLDYKFPRGNGMEIIRKLKGKARFTPAVMITAFGNEEVAIEAMREGALDFLPKTRDFLKALPNVVRRVLERSEIIRERIRNREALERRNRELYVLNRIASLLNRSLELDRILREALEQVLDLTALEGGWVLLRGEGSEELQVVAAGGVPEEGCREVLGAEAHAEVLREGKACLRPGPGWGEGGSEMSSHLLIPLQASGKVLGVLHLIGPVDRSYPWSEMELLTGIGRQVGVAVENALLYQELHQTKAYLQDLVENAGDAIVTFARNGRVLSWNHGASAITGYEESEMIGQAWDCIVAEDRRKEMGRLMQEVLEGRTVSNFETIQKSKSGRDLHMAITLSPLRDEGGRVIGVSSVGKDITKRRQLQEQLIQVEKMAAIGQLISGVAHELNNPLTAVIGYSQLVTTAETGEKLDGYLEKITSEAMRCQKIVQNLLTFAREHKPEKRLLDINDVIRSTLELRRYELNVQGVDVEPDLAEELPLCHADYHQLQQVFINLIINAEHAMQDAGGGTLQIRSRVEEDDGTPKVRVFFEDTGHGIPQENLNKIFEPFFTTKDVGRGTGLGLSLSYGVVRSHEGNIFAENHDRGARFIVEIPAQVISPPQDREEESHPASSTGSGPARRILVVDDEPSIREMFHEALRVDGHRIDQADNGLTALDRIRAERYDLIIADLKMPEMGGQTLYRTLEEEHPSLARRVIFATGDVINADTRKFLEETGNMVISKPCGAAELQRKVQEFFHHLPGQAAATA